MRQSLSWGGLGSTGVGQAELLGEVALRGQNMTGVTGKVYSLRERERALWSWALRNV